MPGLLGFVAIPATPASAWVRVKARRQSGLHKTVSDELERRGRGSPRSDSGSFARLVTKLLTKLECVPKRVRRITVARAQVEPHL